MDEHNWNKNDTQSMESYFAFIFGPNHDNITKMKTIDHLRTTYNFVTVTYRHNKDKGFDTLGQKLKCLLNVIE